jgi:hypothetical protein
MDGVTTGGLIVAWLPRAGVAPGETPRGAAEHIDVSLGAAASCRAELTPGDGGGTYLVACAACGRAIRVAAPALSITVACRRGKRP